ncbi:MAG: chloride channel protein [Deltaproteobacteria bacterium]|nr:chloride channel protein [Deltaproteobacteria bacterium]
MRTLSIFVESLEKRFLRHERVFSLLLAVVIGLISGLTAVGLRWMIEGIQHGFSALPALAERVLGTSWPGLILIPVLGGLAVGPLIVRFAPEAKGHGVPEVMAAIVRRGGFIRPRVAWIKAVASAITIGSGGSVGREGPIIQIGSSIGSTLGYLLHLPPRLMRTLVACGAAGGIAAAFNAPIAGSLFAVEIILGDFGFVQLAPIVTSAVIATVVSRSMEGDFAAFGVPIHTLVHPLELIPYVGLGLLCGVGAVLFIETLDYAETFFEKKVRLPEMLKPALGGLMIGVLGLALPHVLGMGYQAIDSALHSKLSLLALILLVAAKLLATSITLASGGSGGIFAPSLFMGAMLGGVVGKVANWVSPDQTADSGAYALVGMSAMVGAATHAPITAIVIIFELTNDYKIILPLMISTIIAVLTANTLKNESIYTHKLKRKGIDLEQGPEINVLKRVRVGDVMRSAFDSVPHDLPFNFLMEQLMSSHRSHLPVVDEQMRLIGCVQRDLAQHFSADKHLLTHVVIARDLAENTFTHLLPLDALDKAMLRFNESGLREIYVLQDEEQRKVVGMVRKGDLLDAYQRELIKLDSGDTFAYSINNPHRLESVKVLDGYGILEMEAPHTFSGSRLAELDLRNRFGVNVLAIKRHSSKNGEPITRVWVPESADQIEDGDVLVLLGRTENLNQFVNPS